MIKPVNWAAKKRKAVFNLVPGFEHRWIGGTLGESCLKRRMGGGEGGVLMVYDWLTLMGLEHFLVVDYIAY